MTCTTSPETLLLLSDEVTARGAGGAAAGSGWHGFRARGGRTKLRKDLRVVRQLVTGRVERCRRRAAEAPPSPSAHYVSCKRQIPLWNAGFGWNSRRPLRPGLAGRPIGPARQAGGRTQAIPFTLAQRASVGSTEASNGRLARAGVIDRSVEQSLCALRCRRTDARNVDSTPASGRTRVSSCRSQA